MTRKNSKLAGENAVPLGSKEAVQWEQNQRALIEIAQDFERGIVDKNKFENLPKMDMNKVLNALYVPEDAGEYEAGLRAILMRIPDNWGRWISCERGWYSLIIDLNQKITALDPGYEVYQVKEKFGTLRYYCAGDGNRKVRKLIAKAEKASSVTCEGCGGQGRLLTKDDWDKTLCDLCAVKNGYLDASLN